MKNRSNILKSLIKLLPIFCVFIIILQNSLSADWGIQTLDGQNNVNAGRHCTLAVDSPGKVHIIYMIYENANSFSSLKYITNELNTPDTWDSFMVDSPSNINVGMYSSIIFDTFDTIHAGYYNLSGGDLKYTTTSDGLTNWSTSNVDTQDTVGEYTDIAIDASNGIHMSYYNLTDMSLKYAYKPASGTWTTETVSDLICGDPSDLNCMVGKYTSIGVDSDGTPHIIYFKNSYGYLKHAYKPGVNWIIETADDGVWADHYTSMVIDGTDIHIAFYDRRTGNQMYTTNSTGTWVSEVAHNSLSDLGKYSSIGLDTDGNVHIAYYDETENDLEYTTKKNGLWINQTVESYSSVGSFASLAMDGDKINIAYFNNASSDLKYAYYNPDAPYVTSTVPANLAEGAELNRSLVIAFSEEMDSASITATSVTVEDDQNNAVIGTINYDTTGDTNTAVFTPNASLTANTTYSMTIAKTITDESGTAMAKDFQVGFTTSASVDTTLPEVELTYPGDTDTAIPTNSAIMILFSEEINPLTLTSTTFQLNVDETGAAVSGSVAYDAGNRIGIFTTANLTIETEYQATITTGVEDLSGNALVSDYSFNFTTGTGPDTTNPYITNVTPAEGAIGVIKDNVVTIQFSEPINPLTLIHNNFSLSESSPNTITYNWYTLTATLTFTEPFGSSKFYTATALNGIQDFFGNSLNPNKQWTFTTTPGIRSTWPQNFASNIDTNITLPIEAVFYGDMDPATINSSTFTMTRNGATAPSTVTYNTNERTAYLQLPSNLTLYSGATYTLTITTGAQDTNGAALEEDYVWTFTTFGDPSGGGSGGGGACYISTLL